jgi:Na+-translocating ferredoxin:NAD+ oxidoreductase RNF subunit RnfB/anti-sigma regulatory factor (Ser/Thr protein kinase)
LITLSYHIYGGDFDSGGLATRKLKDHLARLGVDNSALRRAMIAAYEAEMNVVVHARTGTLWARLDEEKLDLEVADEGPGIPDIELAMTEGWSTASEQARQMGFGAGLGLPNIRRSSDRFEIETRVGRGTRIRATILFGAVSAKEAGQAESPAPLQLEAARCRGCRRCVFACPVGALRVRDKLPVVLLGACMGCTACIDECPDGVFGIRNAATALPKVPEGSLLLIPRGFLAAFPVRSPVRIMATLRRLGFADVRLLDEWDESLLVEARREASSGKPLPRIPPLCSSVVALVESRFPSLIPHLSRFLSPAEAACEEFPLRSVVLMASCPQQFAECSRSSLTDRLTVIAPAVLRSSILMLLSAHAGGRETELIAGPRAAPAPGEVAASGPRAVMRTLSEAETGALDDVSVLDLRLCAGGCSGSPLVARRPAPAGPAWTGERPGEPAGVAARLRPFNQRPGVRLDADMAQAMAKLSLIDSTTRRLPGRDCGSCGAPSCAAFAEDVVLGRAHENDCPYMENKR